MLRKRTKIVMTAGCLIIVGCAILICGFAYSIYSWLRVEPLVVLPDVAESDRIEVIDQWLEKQFVDFKFNGGVLILREGRVLLSKTYGFVDHTAHAHLTSNTAFPLASVSKQFTAAGVLRLVELGKLKLDDPLSTHIEGLEFEGVTIRHLLNQTSGIPDEYMMLAEKHRERLGEVLTISEAVDLIKEHLSWFTGKLN